jgi:hypothetical protein
VGSGNPGLYSVGLTGQMKYQGSQIPYNNMGCLLGGGGKCGPRSSFGTFICQAWGIPATGLGQPAHAAVGFRDRDGNWQTAFGRGWNVSTVIDRGKISGGEWLQRTTERKNGIFETVEHLRWLGVHLGDESKKKVIMAAADSIGQSLNNIITTIPFNTKPTKVVKLRTFSAPANAGDHYGARVRAFIYPPETGDYVFGIAADDMGDLFLSPDDDPDNRQHIANNRDWVLPGDYTKFPSQKSKPIRLTGGKKYYIEGVFKENGGGDYMTVGWDLATSKEKLTLISGKYLASYPSERKGYATMEVWQGKKPTPKADTMLKFTPEAPIKVARGVIHVEAEDFIPKTMGGQGGFGPAEVAVNDCALGGKQINFPPMVADLHLGYKITVPRTGMYDLTASTAAINWHQKLYVRAFGAMPKAKSAKASHVYNNLEGLNGNQIIDDDPTTRWAVMEGREVASVEVDYGKPIKMSCVMIDERLFNRIAGFNVEYKAGNDWKRLYDGKNIGISYAKTFPEITAQHVRLNLLDGHANGGPTIWSFNMGTVMDGQAWIASDWTMGEWAETKPTKIRLVKGEQTIWLFAPFQRGLALRWFRFTPSEEDRSAAKVD